MADPAHEHEHVEPAHAYTAAAGPTTAARSGWGIVGLIVRIILTLAGAAGLIMGAFLDWFQGKAGVDLDIRALWQTTFDKQSSTFIETVGFVMIELYRADQTVADVRVGAWVALAGAVVALIGGFFGTRTVVAPAGTTGPTVVEP